MRRGTADLMLLLTMCLWALNFAATKYVLSHGFTTLGYSASRYASAAVIFGLLTIVLERSLRVGRRDVAILAAGGVVLFVNQIGFTYALRFSTATTVALVFGTFPIFTGLFAAVGGIERLTRRELLGATVSFAGVVLVAAGSGGALSASLKGDAFALLAAATWAGYSVAMAPLMSRLTPMRMSFHVLSIATVLLTLAGTRQLAEEGYPSSWRVWGTFAYCVLGPLVLTNVLWFTALKHVGPGRASLFYNLQFFVAAVLGLVLLSESVTAVQVVGGAAIAGAIVLSRRPQVPVQAVE